ncbi:unnamed protein product [Effrenium voratum]|nr:unnamed protein product [Effrenium voratum]
MRLALFAFALVRPSATGGCLDRDGQCGYWAAIGECEANPRYMLTMCQASCHVCDEAGALRERLYAQMEQQLGPAEGLREVSYSPHVLLVDRFFSDEECEALKDLARPHMRGARTINRSTGAASPDKVRTNSQFYLDQAEHYQVPLVAELVRRMHVLARMPDGHGEPLQVGQYHLGEFYQPHFDSELSQNLRRAVTVLVYLDPPKAGGETIFPKHRKCQDADFADCCNRTDRRLRRLRVRVEGSATRASRHARCATSAKSPCSRFVGRRARRWFSTPTTWMAGTTRCPCTAPARCSQVRSGWLSSGSDWSRMPAAPTSSPWLTRLPEGTACTSQRARSRFDAALETRT